MVNVSRLDEGLRWQTPELMIELGDGDLSRTTKSSDVTSVMHYPHIISMRFLLTEFHSTK